MTNSHITSQATGSHMHCLPLLLDEIETELRQLGCWSSQPPAASAFASQLPFSSDKMLFDEWLQWVFLARFRALIEGDLALPQRCQIAPMAEQALPHIKQDISSLLALLHTLDGLFNNDPHT